MNEEEKKLVGVEATLNKLLPPELRCTLQVHVLARAVCREYITIVDDHLQWQWESHTLLAYLVGRMLGDKCARNAQRMPYWRRSTRRAPEAQLHKLFGIPNLGQIRRNRAGLSLPENFSAINELFED